MDEGSLPEHFQGLYNDLHKHFKVDLHFELFFSQIIYNSFVNVF